MPMRRFVVLGLLWGLLLGGCGGGDDGGGTKRPPVMMSDGGLGSRECVDEDGDGFGLNCGDGLDCDDEDPEMTDECVRCASPSRGCPCEKGTEPMKCKPPPMAATMNGVEGIVVCNEGARYCRDEKWSDCEILWQYATFVPDT